MHMNVSAEWRERIKAYWLRRCFQTIYYYLFIFCLALPAACCSFLLAQSRNINASPSFSWMGPHMSTKNPYMWRLSVYLVQSNMFSFCVTPFLRAKTILQMIEETAVSEIQQCSPRGEKKKRNTLLLFWSGVSPGLTLIRPRSGTTTMLRSAMFGSTWPLFAFPETKSRHHQRTSDVSASLIPVVIHDHMYFLDCINYVFVGVMNAPPLIGTLEGERERERVVNRWIWPLVTRIGALICG